MNNKNKKQSTVLEKLEHIFLIIGRWIAILMAIYHIYTSVFGIPSAIQHRAIHLGLGIIIAFLTIPISKKIKHRGYSIFIDFSLIILCILIMSYVCTQYIEIANRVGSPTLIDIILGIITILLIFELSRRVVGPVLIIVPTLFLLYVFFGQYIPGFLGHRPYSVARTINTLFLSIDGIFGAPLGASSVYVAAFIILGSVFELTGLGKFFINLAYSITGRSSSGPAQTAVVASGLFGMITGSSSSNVATTGTFTIPLMKSIGYKPEMAGAIEAISSVGGQIMPPIMGTVAFIIAENLEVPYSSIILKAFLPAMLYYISIAISVHLQAKKKGINASLSDIGNPLIIIKQGWYYLISMFVLLYLLIIVRYSPYKSAMLCVFLTLIISFVQKKFKYNVKDILFILEISSKRLLTIISACAASGIVIGVITLTGLGLKISMLLLKIGQNNLLLILIITHITAIILGMGLPSVAAYITASTLLAPALIKLGIPPLTAHFFIFYGAIVSHLTPPVCLASYVAAGIAKADTYKTAINAFLLGIPGPYLVPYIFVFHSYLMLQNNPSIPQVFYSFFVGVMAVSSMAIALRGYFLAKLNIIEKIITILASLLFVMPGIMSNIYGGVLIICCIILQIIKLRKQLVSN